MDELRSLEGEWRLASLEVDGAPMPAPLVTQMRLLFDGDRFRTESPEANYEGVFTIDVETKPSQIDIDFVEGPEAGNTCYGISIRIGDEYRRSGINRCTNESPTPNPPRVRSSD